MITLTSAINGDKEATYMKLSTENFNWYSEILSVDKTK